MQAHHLTKRMIEKNWQREKKYQLKWKNYTHQKSPLKRKPK
jgi:hypothetical protein